MLDTLIQSKTRIKLLLRFFLNPESTAYLRGLAQEFNESTNSVRIELNRFESAGLIIGQKEGNKKVYVANTGFPMFADLQRIAFKHFGIDHIVEQIICKIGDINAVYITGDLARGLDTQIIDIIIIGHDVDGRYLQKLVQKVERMIDRRIRTLVYEPSDEYDLGGTRLLIYGNDTEAN